MHACAHTRVHTHTLKQTKYKIYKIIVKIRVPKFYYKTIIFYLCFPYISYNVDLLSFFYIKVPSSQPTELSILYSYIYKGSEFYILR